MTELQLKGEIESLKSQIKYLEYVNKHLEQSNEILMTIISANNYIKNTKEQNKKHHE